MPSGRTQLLFDPLPYRSQLRLSLQQYFGELEEEVFNDFEEQIEWVRLKENDLLVQQGAEGDSMYILIEGQLLVIYEDVSGQKKTVGEISPGEGVGEMALFTGEKRSASIHATVPSILVKLSQEVFDGFITKYPSAIKNIAQLIIHRLRGLINVQVEVKLLESELLLKEMHHRVKNNLQVISSLLNLQLAQIDNPGVREAVQTSQDRVKSMALIHQKLYQKKNQEAIEMKDYLSSLTDSLLSSYGVKKDRITLSIEVEPILLDVDSAIPIGLIANELITNALKYAFPDQAEGTLLIGLYHLDDIITLRVADNGVGMEEGKSSKTGTSFGSQMINLLRLQLQGTIEVNTDAGTDIQLKCKNFKLIA